MRFLVGLAVLVSGVAAAILFAASGLHEPSTAQWRERVHTWSAREASGQFHIVEIDAASLAEVNRWPWPRSHYARLVDQLDAAGVRSIAFDVDFSSPSSAGDDAAFAAALERATVPVFLPTFAQVASDDDRRSLESLPIPELRKFSSLASVMMGPDEDGFVRALPMGTVTAGAPRPSLAAASAGVDGAVGDFYALDLSVMPNTIPRHSFVDIERGAFDPAELRGRDVLVGATAIEVFDRYPVPIYGVIPGVVVQALGAETLLAGPFIEIGWVLPLTLVALSSIWVMAASTIGVAAMRSAAILVATLVIGFGLQALARFASDIGPAVICLATVTACSIARHLHRRFQHERFHDAGSDLPNRRAFEHRGEIGEERFTIALAIDNFEALRAVLGEAGSDALIARLADRVGDHAGIAQVYRIDRHILAWTICSPEYEPEYELRGLERLLRTPMQIDARAVDVTSTFGVAANDALDEAIHAARIAASEGRIVAFHADAEQHAMEQRVSLLGELDAAIDREELQVWFQPQLDLASNRIESVEALVRWQHPTRGFLGPSQFIPLAEKANRIDALTLYVLRKSIEALKAWCEQDIVLRAAINISARLLSEGTFVEEAQHLIATSDIPRDRLVFEITESATLDDSAASAATLHRLRALGIAISIDDYGTGQSSLSYLKTMPLSELKIDRSFVQNAHREPSDAMLVRSTIQLAHELGLTVVAEGVEEAECIEFLRSVDCDVAQGYFIGEPMAFEDISDIAIRYSSKAA